MIAIIKNDQNLYHFVVNTESGHILLNSVHFSNENEVEQAVDTIRHHKTTPLIFERKTNHNGQFLFNLKNEQNELIGSSQLYNSESGMENGIKNLSNRIKVIYSK